MQHIFGAVLDDFNFKSLQQSTEKLTIKDAENKQLN